MHGNIETSPEEITGAGIGFASIRDALNAAIDCFDTQSAFAEAIGYSQQSVSGWVQKLKVDKDALCVSVRAAALIPNITDGKVPSSAIRPDIFGKMG